MRYRDLLKTVLGSRPDQWHSLAAPTGLQYLGEVTKGGQYRLEVLEYVERWVLTDDVRIALAYGLPTHDGELTFAWPSFPDAAIRGRFADVLFNGQPVHRAYLLSVDGGRAVLPSPANATADTGQVFHEQFAYTTSQADADFARLIDQLIGRHEFDGYLEQTGMIILPEET